MKIWIDGQCFQTSSNVRGIGRYVIDFVRSLSQLENELIISLNGSMQEEAICAIHYLRITLPSVKVKIWYGTSTTGEKNTAYCAERMVDEKLLAAHINAINPDIAVSASPFEGATDRASPFIKTRYLNSIKTCCIFYDAIPYRYPDEYLADNNLYELYNRRLEELQHFDAVLTISEFTNAEYIDIYGKNNSICISAALSTSFRNALVNWQHDNKSVWSQLGNYITYVGGMDWRKNIRCLVKAVASLTQSQKGELKLVLVGLHEEKYILPLRDIFDSHGVPRESIIVTGYVSDVELIDIYKNSLVAVQPSRMEGFGLGALEAMACGMPFFCARGSAVSDIVKDESQLFDADVYLSLSALIKRLLVDLDWKQQIVDDGFKRVKDFSWEKTGELAQAALKVLLKEVELKSETVCSVTLESKPRLIVDATATALSPFLSGIQRVMINISEALLEQNTIDDKELILSYSQNTKEWYQLENIQKSSIQLQPFNRIHHQKNDIYLLLDSSWVFLEGQRQRLSEALVMGQEVIHGIYDLGPLTMPAMTDEGMPPVFRRWIEFILGYSTGLVCISKAVADEVYQLIKAIKLPRPMKVGYFRLGADFADAEPNPAELEFTKTRPTFLMVGTIEPRKGQYYGLKAFEKLWAQGVDINLLIIGKAGWDTKILQTILQNHPEKDKRLFWRQGVSDGGLAAAYQSADALIMTSYLEGFGLPVVEAGIHNKPVILSDLPVFREVGEGTPKTYYFTPGSVAGLANAVKDFINNDLNTDFSEVDVTWPTWKESAVELKNVILNNNWYKYYTPDVIHPNTDIRNVGDIFVEKELADSEISHELKIIEGPFVSNDGTHLRIVVAVKNTSNILWSSNHRSTGTFEVNLGFHLYDSQDDCISYDNPRTHIPFVLSPGQEILMPIRVSTDWLAKCAQTVGVELVQEGVRWFGQERKLNLLKPIVEQSLISESYDLETQNEYQIVFLRGPFGNDLTTERYFAFGVINSSSRELIYDDGNIKFKYSFASKEGNNVERGIWAINHFECLEANNVGYVVLFTDASVLNNSESICIEYNGGKWLFNIASQVVSVIQETKNTTIADDSSNQFTWLDDIDEMNESVHEVGVTFDDKSEVSFRGFNEVELTHVWMSELVGEVDFSSLVEERAYARQIKITCAPFVKNIEPIELSLFIGTHLVEKKSISHDFMQYSFNLSKSQFIKLCKNDFRITLETNHNGIESNGERMLSLCISKLVLLLQK
jgi:glycosyltransferase involved in cell wall biosynthesis